MSGDTLPILTPPSSRVSGVYNPPPTLRDSPPDSPNYAEREFSEVRIASVLYSRLSYVEHREFISQHT
jgi:hypothetical protein